MGPRCDSSDVLPKNTTRMSEARPAHDRDGSQSRPKRAKSDDRACPLSPEWDEFSIFARPPPQGPLAHAGTRGIPFDGRCRAGPLICLGRAGDACVLGALERVGDTLYGARVYVKLGRRLAHAHAARQSCSDSLSQLVPDRRPAKSFTFTLGPL